MNIKEIKELIEAVSNADIDDFYFENKDMKLEIKNNKPVIHAPSEGVPLSQDTQPVASVNPQSSESTENGKQSSEKQAEDEGLIPVRSPIVGTFYRAPNPSAPPFVEVGSEVKQNTTVCIVEAMKVMNEIKANCHGKIAKILVNDGDPVEYEQVLMYVSTS